MKRWFRRTLFGVFGASLALGALTACTHGPYHHGWASTPEEQARQRERIVDRVSSHLDLDAAQKARLAALAETLQQQRAAWAGQADPRSQLRALVAAERFDRPQAQALLEKATTAIGTRAPAVIAAFGDFYDSLNPQQQARVREAMERRHGWWRRG
jgi:Spy/CpxP family protein refolding chaperone